MKLNVFCTDEKLLKKKCKRVVLNQGQHFANFRLIKYDPDARFFINAVLIS